MNIKVGIIGGSGYTGIELIRILHQHPETEVIAISSRALQGKKVAEVFPSMAGLSELITPCPMTRAFMTVILYSLQHQMVLP